MFILLFSLSLGHGLAQPVPDLGPDGQPPSADDFDAVPDVSPEGGGQVVVEDEDPAEAVDRLEKLYADLAASEEPIERERISGEIRRVWLDSGSDTVDVLMARAGKAIQQENPALALDLLDVVVVLKPTFAEGWNRRATVFYMTEDFGKSLVDIERTLSIEPRHWGALSGLGIIQRRLGYETEALATFRRALEIHPGLENAIEAIRALEKTAEGDPV